MDNSMKLNKAIIDRVSQNITSEHVDSPPQRAAPVDSVLVSVSQCFLPPDDKE